MPKRFDGDDFEENFEENEEQNEEGFDIDDQAVIEAINLDLMQDAQRYKILEQAAKVASQDFRWFFLSHQEKVKRIHRIYIRFMKIIEKE